MNNYEDIIETDSEVEQDIVSYFADKDEGVSQIPMFEISNQLGYDTDELEKHSGDYFTLEKGKVSLTPSGNQYARHLQSEASNSGDAIRLDESDGELVEEFIEEVQEQ